MELAIATEMQRRGRRGRRRAWEEVSQRTGLDCFVMAQGYALSGVWQGRATQVRCVGGTLEVVMRLLNPAHLYDTVTNEMSLRSAPWLSIEARYHLQVLGAWQVSVRGAEARLTVDGHFETQAEIVVLLLQVITAIAESVDTRFATLSA